MTDVEGGGKMDETGHSTLDIRDDPFAPRDGKTLTWKNIQMTLVSLQRNQESMGNADRWLRKRNVGFDDSMIRWLPWTAGNSHI
mmetsp:Transcript_28345/g.65752  ORF Transcript_28345/g.65752 Transcript_28345/m.65752 type:complete len:84 (-) Transcript_28345:2605-2856(-)